LEEADWSGQRAMHSGGGGIEGEEGYGGKLSSVVLLFAGDELAPTALSYVSWYTAWDPLPTEVGATGLMERRSFTGNLMRRLTEMQIAGLDSTAL
jgi:hypothetical protein